MTQQQFANRIGVSRNTIATYETSVRVPIEAVLLSICREFGVNEEWLRTGEGEMYIDITPDLELSRWFGQLLREEDNSFQKKFLLMLSKLTEEEWNSLPESGDAAFFKQCTELKGLGQGFDKLIDAFHLMIICSLK